MTARYDGPIVDAHHHLWQATPFSHPWLSDAGGEGVALVSGAPEYKAALWPIRPVKTVWIEGLAADPIGEAVGAQTMAEQDPNLCNAIIAHVPLDAPDVESRLAELVERVSNLRGIRDIVAFEDGAFSFARRRDLLEDRAFRNGLAALARVPLSFDLMMAPHQADQVCRLLSDLPDLSISVEHAGSPTLSDAHDRARWRSSIRLLARHVQQVSLKVSALHCRLRPPRMEDLRFVILELLDHFGPQRLMFGSDFPVHDRTCRAADAFSDFLSVTDHLTETEQKAVFHDTACRFYRI